MTVEQLEAAVDHGFARANGIRMHYAALGTGPPVILLHGFPEHWYSWRYQMRALADAGYRAIAPDLRGFGESDKPPSGYGIASLVQDVAGLAGALGLERFALVGHDWGGPIAWTAASAVPEVERLAIVNGPHPALYFRNLVTSSQLWRSWYIYLFQIPGLAERLLRARDYAAIRAAFGDGRRRAPDTITPEDVDRLTDAMRAPGAIEAGLRYYRSVFRPEAVRALRSLRPIEVPTLVIWGRRDRALVTPTEQRLRRWVRGPLDLHVIDDAGHWVPQERPDEVNRLLLDFLRS